MSNQTRSPLPIEPLSQEEQNLFLTFDKELHKTVETLKVEKHKNIQFKKDKLKLEKEINQTNCKLVEMTLVHQKEKEKLKQEFQQHIKQLQFQQHIKKLEQNSKKPMPKIISAKKKPSKTQLAQIHSSVSKSQQQPQAQQKSLSKGFKLMLVQQFIQFFAALIVTRIKLPHKFRSIKRILPMTFILLRLGVFILVTQFRRVYGYVMKMNKGEEGILGRLEAVMRFFMKGGKQQGTRKDQGSNKEDRKRFERNNKTSMMSKMLNML